MSRTREFGSWIWLACPNFHHPHVCPFALEIERPISFRGKKSQVTRNADLKNGDADFFFFWWEYVIGHEECHRFGQNRRRLENDWCGWKVGFCCLRRNGCRITWISNCKIEKNRDCTIGGDCGALGLQLQSKKTNFLPTFPSHLLNSSWDKAQFEGEGGGSQPAPFEGSFCSSCRSRTHGEKGRFSFFLCKSQGVVMRHQPSPSVIRSWSTVWGRGGGGGEPIYLPWIIRINKFTSAHPPFHIQNFKSVNQSLHLPRESKLHIPQRSKKKKKNPSL